MWFGQVVDGQDTHECGRREGEKTERGDEKTERKPDAPRGGADWEDGPPREIRSIRVLVTVMLFFRPPSCSAVPSESYPA